MINVAKLKNKILSEDFENTNERFVSFSKIINETQNIMDNLISDTIKNIANIENIDDSLLKRYKEVLSDYIDCKEANLNMINYVAKELEDINNKIISENEGK